MSQHDMSIANADGATVRADINSGLGALVTHSSGATAPSTTFAYMTWADTSAGLLKMRDSTNTSWLTIGTIGASSFTVAKATQGQHTIWVPAGAMTPTTTNGAEAATEELATNDVMVSGLDFDAATDEHAQFSFQAPKSWDLGTLVFEAVWKDGATAGSGDVVWGFRALAVGNDDALDAAFGTAQTVTDTFITADDLHRSGESAAVTPAGTPAAEDLIIVDVYRDADNGSDTYTQDARLIGVRVHYTTNAETDD